MAITTVEKFGLTPSPVSTPVDLKVLPKERRIEVISASAWQEGGFGVRKYIAVAALTAGAAAACFSMQLPIATACTALSVWCVFSAVVVGAHRVTEGMWIGKPIRQLYAVVMEANSNFMATVVFPLTLFKGYHAAQGNMNGRPILMVNGYLSFGSTWHYQRSRLKREGFGPIYTMNMGSGRSIKTYAAQLAERVLQIQKETGRKDLILVGHSKGGLVSTYFATHLADSIDSKVTDVITIGSPFDGTPFACFALGLDGQEMRSGSAFQRELRSGIDRHKNTTRFGYIASNADGTVHADSAIPDRENNPHQFVVEDLGHTSLLFSSRVADRISSWIKESLTSNTTDL